MSATYVALLAPSPLLLPSLLPLLPLLLLPLLALRVTFCWVALEL